MNCEYPKVCDLSAAGLELAHTCGEVKLKPRDRVIG